MRNKQVKPMTKSKPTLEGILIKLGIAVLITAFISMTILGASVVVAYLFF